MSSRIEAELHEYEAHRIERERTISAHEVQTPQQEGQTR